MRREASLVNAQVSVNRAVFLMNVARGGIHPPSDVDSSDLAIAAHIRAAHGELNEALAAYSAQQELFT